jgi:energy-coupling factor transport system ATP-binding protein
MLKLENVSFKYPGRNQQKTLNNVSLEIEEGTFMAIVGSNGSGKTTMCKLFNGIIPHFFVGEIEGNISVDGINTLESSVANLSKIVGYVYQDFENSIVRPTVLDEVSFAALNFGLEDYKERAIEALEKLDLIDIKNEYIWQLSGGQKHLVALASVVATKPKYIIIDEPVAQLDPFHARQTYEKLKKLNLEENITIIVIEHHTEFIADYCKEVVLLKKGEVQWKKPVRCGLTSVEDLLNSNIFPPQITQVAYNLNNSKNKKLPIKIDDIKEYFDGEIFSTINKESVNSFAVKNKIVELNGIKAGYKSYNKEYKTVIKNLDLNFYEGEKIALVGNNGAGKSTILKLISRLLKPIEGNVLVNGKNLNKKSPEEVSDIVSYIHQNPEEMFIDDSIEKDVAFFLKSRKVKGYENMVNEILQHLNLYEIKESDSRLLSGGQQRRVSLAIGMGMTPEVMLLDEPTASLDISSRRELLKTLKLLDKYIKTTIIATHDMQLVADWANRVIVLCKGEIIFDGTPRKLFKNKEILKLANLVQPQIVDISGEIIEDYICLSVCEIVEAIKDLGGSW